MTKGSLTDDFHRHLNYLRVSVTDRCNLRCLYCVPESDFPFLPHRDILRYEEILRIVRAGVSIGISKVRVTGGEPLVRKGIGSFLKRLGAMEGIRDLSLTTNALRLKDYLDRIEDAGIRRLNISLDTLIPERFKTITDVDGFDTVWKGILAAHGRGFFPVKLNTVAMKGVNHDELEAIAALTLSYPFHVRFIEYMPIGSARFEEDPYMSTDAIRHQISGLGPLVPVDRSPEDGPAERFRIPGAKGEIGFISPISRHFCGSCNRLRLTAAGGLRACLLKDDEADIKTLIRNGGSDEEIIHLFREAARSKPEHHGLTGGCGNKPASRMSAIGG
ncbi:MAG: GTP 3',8-cyclase MoaA [Desulfobacterales bacterium]|jgi:cyclic pyranopterin phosphate synthase